MKNLLSLLTCVLLTGCQTNVLETQYSETLTAPRNLPKVGTGGVRAIETTTEEFEQVYRQAENTGAVQIGRTAGNFASHPTEAIKKLAAKHGGDLVIYSKEYRGKDVGHRTVMTNFTPGRTITSESQGSGTLNFQSRGEISQRTSLNQPQNTWDYYSRGQGNYNETYRRSIFIPGQANYAREAYTYDTFRYEIKVFLSRERLEKLKNQGKIN